MSRFSKNALPFDKYKRYLTDYLRLQGIDVTEGQVYNCPWHEDSTPSFSVFQGDDGYPAFNCFGCSRAGDIYKAVEYCTGETDAGKQFKEIDRIFGGGQEATLATLPRPEPQEKAPAFTPAPAAFARFTDWLKNQPNASDYILGYFSQRAQIKSEGYIHQYPQAILKKLVTYFFWYPGKKAAEQDLGKPTLFAAGVPYAKKDESLPPEQRKIAWWHSGVLAKSPEGYKLLFMDGIESKKINPRAGVSYFPIPSELPEGKPVILMEGEIDAILCQASGIENAYSMGGKGGLTKERIKKYIVPKNIPEIILFADNDTDGGSQKKFGLLPITADDHIRETVPENLIKMGYTGQIRVTVLPVDCGYKDPDDAIRNNRLDLVQQAIADATPYVPQEKTAAQRKAAKKQPLADAAYTEWDSLPLKFFKSFVNKFKYAAIEEEDLPRFFSAAYKACKHSEAIDVLVDWSAGSYDAERIKKLSASDDSPYALESLCNKYNVSAYIKKELLTKLIPAGEILRNNELQEPIVPINYDAIKETSMNTFLDDSSEHSAAQIIKEATSGNLMYHPIDKNNYAFNGVNWLCIEGLAEPICIILTNILIEYLKKHTKLKDTIAAILKRIRGRQFRQNIVKDFNEMPENIFDTNVVKFDSELCKESYTLQDGVADFSGSKLSYRKTAKREEYRRMVLPYTIADLKKAATPQKFINFINSDFYQPDQKTLQQNPHSTAESLTYFLSLIPSRNKKECYGAFFLGEGGTGKSTLCSLLEDLFVGFSYSIPKGMLVAQKTPFENPAAATPHLAEMEGKLLAISQETRKGSLLISDVFKSLTSGDSMSARFLHENLRRFSPTAQIIVSSNYDPKFDGHDAAVIRRLIVFRFNINHRETSNDTLFGDIKTHLKDEYPAILKYLAEKYIELKTVYKGKIPESLECINEKNNYIEDQETDIDSFVKSCLKITSYDNDSFVFSKQVYNCYLKFMDKDISESHSKDVLTQKKLTNLLKRDFQEFKANYKQKRPPQGGLPEWGFAHVSFTALGIEYLNAAEANPDGGLPFGATSPAPQFPVDPPPPTDDPFAGGGTPQPDLPPLTDADGNEIDIY